jgi:lipid-A-disaccharide synthase
MQKPRHIVIVAGEESGDIHAANLIHSLKAQYPDLRISGIGGQHMQDAGAELISDLARYGVTGFTEVFRYFLIIRNAFNAIKSHLTQHKPDLLILVDYPGFNLRLARFAKRNLGLKIIYYISPQIWAWKGKRIHLIKECVDHMAVIFPFEKQLYDKANVPASFVGHPLLEKIPDDLNQRDARSMLELPHDKKIIALLPGSRTHEIERHMPILIRTAKILQLKNPDYHFAIPVAGTVNLEKIKSYNAIDNIPISYFKSKALTCMSAADFVIVASGTASSECALLTKPMCIIYKASLLSYIIGFKLIKIKYLGLCNILANKMVAPEFLQADCDPVELAKYVQEFFATPHYQEHIYQELSSIRDSLSKINSDCSLEDLVAAALPEKNAYI